MPTSDLKSQVDLFFQASALKRKEAFVAMARGITRQEYQVLRKGFHRLTGLLRS